MPNWCEGRIKIRGKFSDVVSCIKNSFEGVKYYKGEVLNAPENITIDDNYISDGEFQIFFRDTVYIKNTRRAFVDGDCCIIAKNQDSQVIAVIQFKQAWAVVPENYIEMSKTYNVDIRIQAFECGMEFSQDVIIEKGKITQNNTIKYDDWGWDCPVPDWGG